MQFHKDRKNTRNFFQYPALTKTQGDSANVNNTIIHLSDSLEELKNMKESSRFFMCTCRHLARVWVPKKSARYLDALDNLISYRDSECFTGALRGRGPRNRVGSRATRPASPGESGYRAFWSSSATTKVIVDPLIAPGYTYSQRHPAKSIIAERHGSILVRLYWIPPGKHANMFSKACNICIWTRKKNDRCSVRMQISFREPSPTNVC